MALSVRVLVVTEYYPRRADPALGVWVHRQALAARAAGAEVRVIVLHRPIPSLATVRALDVRGAWDVVAEPATADLDGLPVRYARYLSPPRPLTYGSWGAWAAPTVRRELRRLAREFVPDLVHAHYASPAGEAVRRVAPGLPLVVSVHGHDVQGAGAGGPAVRATLAHARLVLANSRGTAARCAELGARATRVVHLGADVPAPDGQGTDASAPSASTPTLVTVAHLVARKRHADVIAALARTRERIPGVRWIVVGDGPERDRLGALARSLGVADAITFRGALPPAEAAAAARAGAVFVLPSVDEAFGVAYIEAMAGGVPAVGCAGEDGPTEIAACGGGMVLVPPRDPVALATVLETLLAERGRRQALGRAARATVEGSFTWERCGMDTVAAYREALENRGSGAR